MKKRNSILLCCLLLLTLSLFAACAKQDFKSAVSELRHTLYLGQSESYTLEAGAGKREQPYLADGRVGDISPFFEVKIMAEDHTKTLTISFSIDGKEYGGELSFDNVTERYTYSESIETTAKTIVFTIGTETLTATAVNQSDESGAVLDQVAKTESELFDSLTQNGRFHGEIYIRLLYDEKCYYYVGVTDRSGITRSFLTDESGTILARR